MSAADSQMPILEHLRELRRRMFIAAVAVVVGAVVGFIFRDWLLDLIVDPYEKATRVMTTKRVMTRIGCAIRCTFPRTNDKFSRVSQRRCQLGNGQLEWRQRLG